MSKITLGIRDEFVSGGLGVSVQSDAEIRHEISQQLLPVSRGHPQDNWASDLNSQSRFIQPSPQLSTHELPRKAPHSFVTTALPPSCHRTSASHSVISGLHDALRPEGSNSSFHADPVTTAASLEVSDALPSIWCNQPQFAHRRTTMIIQVLLPRLQRPLEPHYSKFPGIFPWLSVHVSAPVFLVFSSPSSSS